MLVNDYPIHVILRECGETRLRSLEFTGVDMRRIRVWTLAVLARFTHLTSIHFQQCRFPGDMNESLLIRMLASSFVTLERLVITDNELVTDKLALIVAKKCCRLRELELSGCPGVTVLSVVAFCESTMALEQRYNHPLTLGVKRTTFDPMELTRHLANPLLRCGPCWRAQAIWINIGFDRRAIVLENVMRSDLVILVFV